MLYFLIPVYNEQDNLVALHQKLTSVFPEREKYFVFVDDCSSDNSVEMIVNLFKDQKVKIITKKVKAGPGDSFNKGMDWVLEQSTSEEDRLITMEADGTSDISLLPKMVMVSEMGYDFVLASVYAQNGGFQKTSFFRKLLSFWANMIFRVLFDVKVLTLSSFYRVYTLSSLHKIKKNYGVLISENGFICKLEILLKGISQGVSIVELPMVLKSGERVGKSKMKVFKTTISYLRFLVSFRKKT